MAAMRRINPATETPLARKRRAGRILRLLDKEYPDADCALNHKSAWELLVATILSAQCTDVRVNKVTPALFEAFPTPERMADAPVGAIEALVRTTGFFRNKAKALKGSAHRVVAEYGGQVPARIEQLVTLPGVARKTANVVTGTWFGKATGVVVDTHVQRISTRLGLSNEKDPKKTERTLMDLLPRKRWVLFSHQVIHHGRQVCKARRPLCDACALAKQCPSAEWSSPPPRRRALARK